MVVELADGSTAWEHIDLGGEGRGVRARQSQRRQFLGRLFMAFTGGVFLVVVAVLAMVLVDDLLASLVSTSVFVLAFGWAMALLVEKPFDVMSRTAACSAVLAVLSASVPNLTRNLNSATETDQVRVEDISLLQR